VVAFAVVWRKLSALQLRTSENIKKELGEK